jgi:16S rRNA (cytosine967-C5)-methyltransferase
LLEIAASGAKQNDESKMAPQVPGLLVRRIAADILDGVLLRKRGLDEQWEDQSALRAVSERDRALTRRLVATVLRRLGTLRHIVTRLLEHGLPSGVPRLESALLLGAAQILFLDVADHAAVDLSVRLVRGDRRSAPYAGLVNAVLRRLARERRRLVADLDPLVLDTPAWLMRRWSAAYGVEIARAIAAVHATDPPLDLTAKGDPAMLAAKLGGSVLPTGTVRLLSRGPVSHLPGYSEGEWWVQDAAAALPAKLLGNVRGLRVADLCAAPGGKTAQLALAGAHVVAVDQSPTRLARLRENLARLALQAEIIVADATSWQEGPFDGVLLDAPCSATGTIRRHPDIPWLKSEADLEPLTALQRALFEQACRLLKPGGVLVYSTCSLEPEEGEHIVAWALGRNPALRRKPITPDEVGGLAELITREGDLRTLPCHLADSEDPRARGLDGFFAARLEKR